MRVAPPRGNADRRRPGNLIVPPCPQLRPRDSAGRRSINWVYLAHHRTGIARIHHEGSALMTNLPSTSVSTLSTNQALRSRQCLGSLHRALNAKTPAAFCPPDVHAAVPPRCARSRGWPGTSYRALTLSLPCARELFSPVDLVVDEQNAVANLHHWVVIIHLQHHLSQNRYFHVGK